MKRFFVKTSLLAVMLCATNVTAQSLWERIDPAGLEAKLIPPQLPQNEQAMRESGQSPPEPVFSDVTPAASSSSRAWELGVLGGIRSSDSDWGFDSHPLGGIYLEYSSDLRLLKAFRVEVSHANTDTSRRTVTLFSEFSSEIRQVAVALDDDIAVGDTIVNGSAVEVVADDRRVDKSTEITQLNIDIVPYEVGLGRDWQMRVHAGILVMHVDSDFQSETAVGGLGGLEIRRVFSNGLSLGIQGRAGYTDLDYNFHSGGLTSDVSFRLGWSF
jgi:hypothetical protein